MDEQKVYPVSASAGGDNAFIHPCNAYNGRRHYAVCLKVLSTLEAGTARPADNDCELAWSGFGGGCPAVKMREQEREKGQAIYYTPRDQIQNKVVRIGNFTMPPTKTAGVVRIDAPRPSPVSEPTIPAGAIESDHAKLINKLMKEEAAQ